MKKNTNYLWNCEFNRKDLKKGIVKKKINKNSFYFLLTINIYAFLFLQFAAVVDISLRIQVCDSWFFRRRSWTILKKDELDMLDKEYLGQLSHQ